MRARSTLFGRSSSHFTRVARIYAAELGVEYDFQVVRNLMSHDPADYGGNPALKLPALRTPGGSWFGALNICRELARQSSRGLRLIWPEDLDQPLLANAQELVVQAMATEVSLIMAKASGAGLTSAYQAKLERSLAQAMTWLESEATPLFAALPHDCDLSYLEVTLFCLVTHLNFRGVLDTAPYTKLNAVCQRFEARSSARETPYRFDP